MPWTVTDSTAPRRFDGESASRTYFAAFTEPEGAFDEPNDYQAQQAVLTYLNGFVQDYSDADLPITTLSGSPTASQRRLSQYLNYLPLKSISPDEVSGHEGKLYEVAVEWSKNDGLETSFNEESGLSAAVTPAAEPAITAAYSLSAGVTGRNIDMAPLRYLLTHTTQNTSPLTAAEPAWQPGAINVVRPTADAGLVINGLEYARPPVNYTVTLNVSSVVRSSYLKSLDAAANRGTLNTDTVTLGGVSYNPLELNFVEFNAVTNTEGGATLTLGFATEPRLPLTVTAGPDTDLYKASLSDYLHDALLDFYFWESGSPASVTNIGTVYFSGHDYRWPFVENLTQNGENVQTLHGYSIHKIWAEQSYATLFGSASL